MTPDEQMKLVERGAFRPENRKRLARAYFQKRLIEHGAFCRAYRETGDKFGVSADTVRNWTR